MHASIRKSTVDTHYHEETAHVYDMQVHGRVSDIWRSYITERLLWDIDMQVAFTPPMVDQFRTPHDYLADMQVRVGVKDWLIDGVMYSLRAPGGSTQASLQDLFTTFITTLEVRSAKYPGRLCIACNRHA